MSAMNFRGELVGQFTSDNKVLSWNDKDSKWEDFQGETFFISQRNNLEWYKEGALTEVANDVQQVAFSAQSSLAYIIKQDKNSVWKWNYGTP